MPIYHHFYVECRVADGWGVPADFKREPWTFACDEPFGAFAWAHPRCPWLNLFWGPDALFPMRPGPPDDPRGSPLLRYLDTFYDYGRNEDQLCWLPYQELLIDVWDTELLTVWTKVPARHALFFTDGEQPFPSAELRDTGITELELHRLREGRWPCLPVDTTSGRERFLIAKLPPSYEVKVTWRETIAEHVGERYANVFKGLRQYGRAEDLRILSRRG